MTISNNNVAVIVGYIACLGAFFQLLNLGAVPQKLLIFSLITFLLCYKRPRISVKFFTPIFLFLIFVVYSFVSSLLLFQSPFKALFAMQGLIYCVAYFLLGACITVTQKNIGYFRKAFLFILVIQLFAVFFKYLFYGVNEADWLGTLAHGTGQLSMLFPLLCLPIIVVIFKENYIALGAFVVGLFLFGIIGEKRSIVFLMPFFAVFCLYSLGNKGLLRFLLQTRTIITLVSVVSCAALGIITIPSLNSEASESFQGSVSLLFVMSYAMDYLTMDYGGGLQRAEEFAALDPSIQLGRLTIWAFIIDWFLEADITTKLFGLGYGAVTPSVWLHDSNDVIFDTIGVRGALSGANHAILEVGVLGLFLQSSFIIVSYRTIKRLRKYAVNEYYRTSSRILELMFFVFFFDYFFYSTVLFNALPLPFILFAGLGVFSSIQIEGFQGGYHKAY